MYKWMAFDVETSGDKDLYGLQPNRLPRGEAAITSAAFATGPTFEESRGVVAPTKKQLRKVLVACANKSVPILGWNVAFDAAWLIAMGLRDEVHACKWVDGMLAWKHMANCPRALPYKPESYSLKNAVATFEPDHKGYEDGVDFDDMSPEMIKRRLKYNRDDAFLTYSVTKSIVDRLNKAQQKCWAVDCASIPLVADTYVNGIHMDRAKAETLSHALLGEYKKAVVQLRLDGNDVTEEALNSPKQLSELLYDDWGLPVLKHTDKGARSTDRDTLKRLAGSDPRAAVVNTYREAKNNRTKFAEGTVSSLNYTGEDVSYPRANMFGTYTGRMTYSSKLGKGKSEVPLGVPLHQWKRGSEFRDIIRPPDGYTLMELDWASQEFRWVATLSGDETMLSLCREGEDAHTFMGANISQRDYRAEQRLLAAGDAEAKARRQLGKVGNLSLQYRTSAGTLQTVARKNYDVHMTDNTARAVWATYRATYTNVPEYWDSQIEFGKMNGFVETQAGRRVTVGTWGEWGTALQDASIDRWVRGSTCINAPIQGSGADQKYLGLAVVQDILKKYGGLFYYELHDGLFFIAPDDKALKMCEELQRKLSHLPYEKVWGKTYPIEFPVDAKVGKTWGQLQEIEF